MIQDEAGAHASKQVKEQPKMPTEQEAHRRVVENYFETTSSRGSVIDQDYGSVIASMARRLGDWCDVCGKDIVDLGSGTGEWCKLALDRGARSVIGVNLSASEIDFARRHSSAEFVCQDVVAYLSERPPDSIDLIFALNILEHLDKNALVSLLDAAYRSLRPTGRLIAIVPNATSPFGGAIRYGDFTHQIAFTTSMVRQLMYLTGFGAVEFRECGPIPHGLKSTVRYAAWHGMRQLIKIRLLIETGSTYDAIYTCNIMFRLTKTDANNPRQELHPE
jgi:SAM-dependent methyltransferase